MQTTKILSYVTGLVAIGLIYVLYYVVDSKIDEKKEIEQVEARIIDQLKNIRIAELSFQRSHGKYTADWDSLKNYIKNGKIYIISKKEQTFALDYGADSTITTYDTLGYKIVYDSLFSTKPNFDVETLEIAYHSGLPFKIFTGTKRTKTGAELNLIEVMDPRPINPKRKESNEAAFDQPLKFGSKTEVKTSGNWE